MKRLSKILLLFSIAVVFTGSFISVGTSAAFAQCPRAKQNPRLYPDGPYLLYVPSGLRFVSVDERGKLIDTLYRREEGNPFSFDVMNDGQTRSFRVSLHDFAREEAVQPEKGKIFVISDPHSDLESFLSILIEGRVIDRDLNWIYGENSLLVLGDVADRGTDAVAIYWLIYKLEEDAAQHGGKVHFMYGNHEGMVLQDNYKYTNRKYTRLADTLGMRWSALIGPDSELGRWLSVKNTIQIIGRTLFVHGGISPDLEAFGLSVKEVNRLVSENIHLGKKARENAPREVRFLLDSEGPLWFRGLVSDQEKYHPVSEQELDRILKQYDVDRIVVGHTTFDGVKFRYGGKVITVDSEDEARGRKHLAQGIEIENGKVRVVD